MPRVLNKRLHGHPPGAVYVGRPSPFGNPFTHLASNQEGTVKVKTRDEAIERFREHLLSNLELLARVRRELRGKDLVCWCAPARCHADVLMAIANDFVRADGGLVCDACGLEYRKHPDDPELGWSGDGEPRPFLKVLCDGTRVKL